MLGVATSSGLLRAASTSTAAATASGSFLHDRFGLVVAATAASLFFLRFVVAAAATTTTVGVAVSLSRSFSGGTASARTATATTGGRCRLLVATASTRATAAAATVNRAAGGAACIAVTHEVHAQVGEVTQVACEGVASTGAVDIAGDIQYFVGVHGDGASAQGVGECFIFGVDCNHVTKFVTAHYGSCLDEGEVLSVTVHEEGVDFFAIEAFACCGALD